MPDWQQAISLQLFDDEGEVVFRADLPIEVVERDGEHVMVCAPTDFQVGADGGSRMVATAGLSAKHSNTAGREMARAALPPEPSPDE